MVEYSVVVNYGTKWFKHVFEMNLCDKIVFKFFREIIYRGSASCTTMNSLKNRQMGQGEEFEILG